MTTRPPAWNNFEAAILLDAFLAVREGTVSRVDAVKRVSADLRKLAANKGREVDDLYRNENGILFQMYSMESAYYGRTIFKPATKLFSQIASLYHNNPDEFRKLLKEAKAMIEEKITIEDDFKRYLAEKASPDQLAELYPCYSEIEKFRMKLGILQEPLLETTDFEIIKKVQRTIERNKIFWITRKKQYNKILAACRYYFTYIKEGCFAQIGSGLTSSEITTETFAMPENPTLEEENEGLAMPEAPAVGFTDESAADNITLSMLSKTEQDERLLQKYPIFYKQVYTVLRELSNQERNGVSITKICERMDQAIQPAVLEEILDNVSWASCEGNDYLFSTDIVDHHVEINEPDFYTTENSANDIVYAIDFEGPFDLAYSKPQSLTYCGENKQFGNSWTDLYVTLVAILHEHYPQILLPGISFSKNNTRVELSENTNYSFMFAPKPIPGTTLMLETNISANGIVTKIKYLLELCGVDFSNVVITYKRKDVAIFPFDHEPNHTSVYHASLGSDNRTAFFQYLRDTLNMAETTCRSYVSAINSCEAFAKEHHFAFWELYTHDKSAAEQTVRLLMDNSDFQEYNARQHNRFHAALQKYILFIGAESPQEENAITHQQIEVQEPYKNEPIEAVLKQKFVKGFRMESPLEIRKLRRYYAVLHGTDLTESDEKISDIIRSLCIIYDGKAFLPDVMVDNELKEKLFAYIDAAFADGKNAIYYQAIYTEFADAFLDHHIYDADMLKAYLAAMGNGKFYINRSYISKEPNVTMDPLSEIRSCLMEYGRPVEYEELFRALPHLPQSKIKQILSSNIEFVNNGQGAYFHESILRLSEEGLEEIAEIIRQTIEDKDFIGGNELYDAIQAKYSHIIEENRDLSVYGFRDALKAKLGDQFSFKGNIISQNGRDFSMADVFAKYSRHHDAFTLSELQGLASNLATIIYFDEVYANSLRISRDQFVSKKMAQFAIPDTDEALDRVCTGKYIPIREVTNFGAFPFAGFPWNSFLLEHYVANYSQKYKLLHSNFSGTECSGAIVRRSAGIESFDDLIVDLLVNNPIEMKKASVLQYLRDYGYLARRRYSEIESLIIKANAQKQRKDEN